MVAQTRSSRAGLIFPVNKIQKRLNFKYKTTLGAAIYMAAVCQYIATELVEICGDAAQKKQSRLIRRKHIKSALRQDAEMLILTGNITKDAETQTDL